MILPLSLVIAAIASEAPHLPATIEGIKPAVVAVGTYQKTRRPPAVFLATGFAVGDGQHVVTNAHVLPDKLAADKREFVAVFAGEGELVDVREAQKVGEDRDHDLVVLRISGSPLPVLTLGDSDRVKEGQLLAFTGFPIGMVLGLHPVTHRGIISAITPIAIPRASARQLDKKLIARLTAPYEVFQLDATAYPGNSGSPLYETDTGRVVGIINKVFVQGSKENILQKPSGITYAIPIKYLVALLKKAGVKY